MIGAKEARKLALKHEQKIHKDYESLSRDLKWQAENGFSNGHFRVKGEFISKAVKDAVKKKYRTFVSVDGLTVSTDSVIKEGVCPECVYELELEW
jgi:hypothetical protein